MSRAGMKIAELGQDVGSARPYEFVLDTDLETLPIDEAKPWRITTIGPDFSSSNAINYAYVYHNLGYAPIFKAWVEVQTSVDGATTKRKYRMPYRTDSNFSYVAFADKDKVTIVSTFITPDYPGATFEANGFVYIFDKEFDFKS